MSWTARDLPDVTGTVAVVTGANSGIGFHTAKHLARRGATVVLACRDTAAGAKAAAAIDGETRVEKLDLASQASVRDFAERWSGPLDLLVNNAGIMRPPAYRETEDGHELMFGTNHLGHFALTGRLLPTLLASATPRVVTVASIAHFGGDEHVVDANPESSYAPEKSYGQSKLANVFPRAPEARGRCREPARLDRRPPRRLGDRPGLRPQRHGRKPGDPRDHAGPAAAGVPVRGGRRQPDPVRRDPR
jgi:hypothetical protein